MALLGMLFLSRFSGQTKTPSKPLPVRTDYVGDQSLLESCPVAARGKAQVRKVLSVLAAGTTKPYGQELLLEPHAVIQAIESLPFCGKTLLCYFISVTCFLKHMAKHGVAEATRSAGVLRNYKNLNYQHFAYEKGKKRKLSEQRPIFVNEHKEAFERCLLKVIIIRVV